MGSSGDQVMSSQLPPGFRFHPTDQELINCYLRMKINGSMPLEWGIIADIDLYNFDPWELPERAFFGEREWFFFSHRNRKYPNGDRPNRAASSGYWKATGTDKLILATGGSECIGVKKALVFYKGRPPKGIKTEWVMQEYRLIDSLAAPFQSLKQNGRSMKLDDWVLCRVQQKVSLRTASSDVTETCSPPESIGTQSEETQGVVKEGNSFPEWRDNQLLLENYPVESHEIAESTLEDSDLALYMRQSHLGGRGDYTEPLQCWSSPLIIPSIYSSKRKIPFGALDDELMLMQPAIKRFQFLADGLLSLAE